MKLRDMFCHLKNFSRSFNVIHKHLLVKSFYPQYLTKFSISYSGILNKKSYHNVLKHDYCSVSSAESNYKLVIPSIFSRYGFSEGDSNFIINKCPNIEQLNEENLIQNLNCWLQCQFGENRLISLIIKHPNLLLINSKRIERLYVYLATKYTKDYTYRIFFNSPQLLMDKEDIVKEKIAYLENQMNVPKVQIVNSCALAYSLHHIKERHEFLKRVGIYKSPNKKTIEVVNPRLDTIMCSSNEEFSAKVAGVSLLEYEVFQQLYLEEEGEEEEEEEEETDI